MNWILPRVHVKAVVWCDTWDLWGFLIPCSQVSGCDVDDVENTRVATTPEFTFPCDTRLTRQHCLLTGLKFQNNCPFLKDVSVIYGMIWDILGSVKYSDKMIRQLFDDSLKEIFLKNNHFFPVQLKESRQSSYSVYDGLKKQISWQLLD